MGAVLVQLLPFLVPQAVALIKAIVALKKAGVAPADVAALVAALSTNIASVDAETLDLLAGIPLPTPK